MLVIFGVCASFGALCFWFGLMVFGISWVSGYHFRGSRNILLIQASFVGSVHEICMAFQLRLSTRSCALSIILYFKEPHAALVGKPFQWTIELSCPLCLHGLLLKSFKGTIKHVHGQESASNNGSPDWIFRTFTGAKRVYVLILEHQDGLGSELRFPLRSIQSRNYRSRCSSVQDWGSCRDTTSHSWWCSPRTMVDSQ